MPYFYLHPHNPQYFFPKDFKKFPAFITFYKPYSTFGVVSWWLFRNIGLYRNFFKADTIENFIPEREIRIKLDTSGPMVFNRGTVGPEQKITALAYQEGVYFFIKYGCTPMGSKNVAHEHHILNKMVNLDFVPKVLDFYEGKQCVLLKTNVLQGKRLGYMPFNKAIRNRLFELAKMDISSKEIIETELNTSFAHGDFCPWNMMETERGIMIYDWEMAGNYPLGYDMFTFIFQTNFLLRPRKSIFNLLSENKEAIEYYFQNFDIKKWEEYLIAFAQMKIKLEQKKGMNKLLRGYEMLLAHFHNDDKIES